MYIVDSWYCGRPCSADSFNFPRPQVVEGEGGGSVFLDSLVDFVCVCVWGGGVFLTGSTVLTYVYLRSLCMFLADAQISCVPDSSRGRSPEAAQQDPVPAGGPGQQ